MRNITLLVHYNYFFRNHKIFLFNNGNIRAVYFTSHYYVSFTGINFLLKDNFPKYVIQANIAQFTICSYS